MNEIDFIKSIDANFPYSDEIKWRETIINANRISANASFMVLHEICRAPKNILKQDKLKMLLAWDESCNHPIKNKVMKVARSLLEGKTLSVEETIKLFEEISFYQGLHNALNIAYFACNDRNKEVDFLYEKILKKWEAEGTSSVPG